MGLKLSLDERTPLVAQCEGCLRADGEFCGAYLFPEAKWGSGVCTGRLVELVKDKREKKRRIGRTRNIMTYNVSKYRRDVLAGKKGKRGKK